MKLIPAELLVCGTILIAAPFGSLGKMMSPIDQMDNNVINNSPPERMRGYQGRDWVNVSFVPPLVVNTRLGERVEIECEAQGSPAPEILWLRGNIPVQQTERVVSNVHQNVLPGSFHDKAGLAKMRSRLIINCVTAKDEGFYTCSARSGLKKMKAKATLLLIQGGDADSCKETEESAPRIVSWSPMSLDYMGVDLLLPCVAVGNPPPVVYWQDQENNVINNYRYQVINNGDLAIYRLSWPDMGQYTCVAENSAGKDKVTTFVYPVQKEEYPME